MLIKGQESTVAVRSRDVLKRYNARYFDWNRRCRRKGEPYFLRTYHSPFFVRLVAESDGGIVLEKGDGSLGTAAEFRGDIFWNCDKLALRNWLQRLPGELRRLGIQHHDINPANLIAVGDAFRLIDFGWATEGEPSDFPHDPGLNRDFGTDDRQAVRALVAMLDRHLQQVESIRRMIATLGTAGYRDGSTVHPGWAYHPIPFADFHDIPVHKTACIDEYQQVRKVLTARNLLNRDRLLDVGCALGYFTLQLCRDFGQVVAIEADAAAAAIVRELCRLYCITNVEVRNKRCDQSDFGTFDVMLCLNVHMWLHKQLGSEATLALMRHASRHVRHLFFQTAHRESRGMSLVHELRDRDAIERYLLACGFSDVELLQTTGRHGGLRHLFYARGRLAD